MAARPRRPRPKKPDPVSLLRTRALDWVAYALLSSYVLVALVVVIAAIFAHQAVSSGVVSILAALAEYLAAPTILGLAGMSAVNQIWGGGFADTAGLAQAPGTMGDGVETQQAPVTAPPTD